MNDKEIDGAIAFNERQSFSESNVRMIQRVVGAPCHGAWDAETVIAVYEWQRENGIAPDGKIWRNANGNTWPKILDSSGSDDDDPTPTVGHQKRILRKGVWVDDERRIQQEPYFDRMLELDLTVAALMLDTTQRAWDPVYTDKELEGIARLAVDRNIEVVFTVWPFPDRQVIDNLTTDVKRMLSLAPKVFRAVEGDTEFNWHPKKVRGFNNLDEAGDYYVEKLSEACEPTRARKELTTFTSHTENGRAADVSPHMDLVFGQAYSVRHRNKRDGSEWLIPWDHLYGPGQMQAHTLDRSLQVPGVPDVVSLGCGLAAYDQRWPGHNAKEAMKVAYDAAVARGVVEIRWWSFKWVCGHLSNRTPYAAEFLKEIANR